MSIEKLDLESYRESCNGLMHSIFEVIEDHEDENSGYRQLDGSLQFDSVLTTVLVVACLYLLENTDGDHDLLLSNLTRRMPLAFSVAVEIQDEAAAKEQTRQ